MSSESRDPEMEPLSIPDLQQSFDSLGVVVDEIDALPLVEVLDAECRTVGHGDRLVASVEIAVQAVAVQSDSGPQPAPDPRDLELRPAVEVLQEQRREFYETPAVETAAYYCECGFMSGTKHGVSVHQGHCDYDQILEEPPGDPDSSESGIDFRKWGSHIGPELLLEELPGCSGSYHVGQALELSRPDADSLLRRLGLRDVTIGSGELTRSDVEAALEDVEVIATGNQYRPLEHQV